jgi:hypothetical protein
MKKTKQVTKPVLSFKNGPTTIQVWVLNPGQWCKLGEHRSFTFPHQPGDKTASLIYETISSWGHEAVEHDIGEEGTWNWIQEWMNKGFKAEGIPSEVPPHSESEAPVLNCDCRTCESARAAKM